MRNDDFEILSVEFELILELAARLLDERGNDEVPADTSDGQKVAPVIYPKRASTEQIKTESIKHGASFLKNLTVKKEAPNRSSRRDDDDGTNDDCSAGGVELF